MSGSGSCKSHNCTAFSVRLVLTCLALVVGQHKLSLLLCASMQHRVQSVCVPSLKFPAGISIVLIILQGKVDTGVLNIKLQVFSNIYIFFYIRLYGAQDLFLLNI